MRLRTIPPDQPARRRRVLRTVQVLPTLMTAGNLMVGVLACAYMIDAGAFLSDAARVREADALFSKAAWLIFIGMVLDGLDGRVARMTNSTSAFGAQLDSLADVVTFGVAPALVAKTVLGVAFTEIPPRLLFVVCLVYVVGAAMRLARYNVESERLSREGSVHVTRVFRGLPSPAAAGVIAGLLLLRSKYATLGGLEWIEWGLLAATPLMGLLMISRMPFSHVMNRYFDRRRAGPLTVVILLVLLYLIVSHFVETVAGLFMLYALSGPMLTLTHRMFGVPRIVDHEEHDEEVLEGLDVVDLEPVDLEPVDLETEDGAEAGSVGGDEISDDAPHDTGTEPAR